MIETDLSKVPLGPRIILIESVALSIDVEQLRAHIAHREASIAADPGPFIGDRAKARELFLLGIETEKLLAFYITELKARSQRKAGA